MGCTLSGLSWFIDEEGLYFGLKNVRVHKLKLIGGRDRLRSRFSRSSSFWHHLVLIAGNCGQVLLVQSCASGRHSNRTARNIPDDGT